MYAQNKALKQLQKIPVFSKIQYFKHLYAVIPDI